MSLGGASHIAVWGQFPSGRLHAAGPDKRYGVREDLWSVGEISSLGVSRQLEEPVGRGEDEQITLPGNTDEVSGFEIKSEHNHISKRRG